MPKAKNKESFKEKIYPRELNEFLEESMGTFGYNTNLARSFPSIYDGLKPISRRIITAMYELNLFPNKPYMKMARTISQTMLLSPHGDASIEDAIVKMEQPFYLMTPWVDGSGSWGSIAGDGAAASRYISNRMTKYCEDNLENFEVAVEWVPNYDGLNKEPEVIPVKYPNLLINGSFGIGVGFSTGIPTHNFEEVCNLVIDYIKNKDLSLDEISSRILPDYPTGGIIINGKDNIKEIYKTGQGNIKIIAKTEIDDKNRIVITETPYGKTLNQIKEKLQDSIKAGNFQNISRVDDGSNKKFGIRLYIIPKQGTDPKVLEKQLLQSILSNTIPIQLICVDGLNLKTFNIKEIIEKWYNFRVSTLKRVFNNNISDIQLKIHKLEGLIISLSNIDEVIKIIKKSEDRAEAEEKLVEKYDLTKIQANYITEMKLYVLTKFNIEEVKNNVKALKEKKEYYQSFFRNSKNFDELIIEQLKEGIGKYNIPRRTKILDVEVNYKNNKEDLSTIENSKHILIITKQGYIKKIDEIRSVKKGGKGQSLGRIKEGDFVTKTYRVNNHDILLCISNLGKLYKLPVYKIMNSPIENLGYSLHNFIKLDKDEIIIAIRPIRLEDFNNENLHLVFLTKKGFIKRTKMTCFKNTPATGIIAIKLDSGDSVLEVKKSFSDNDNILVISKGGYYSYYKANELRSLLRSSRGVSSGKWMSDEEDIAVALVVVNDNNIDKFLIVIDEKGFGKRISLRSFVLSNREKNSKLLLRKGKVQKCEVKNLEDNIVLTSQSNIFSIHVEDIKKTPLDDVCVTKVVTLKKGESIL